MIYGNKLLCAQEGQGWEGGNVLLHKMHASSIYEAVIEFPGSDAGHTEWGFNNTVGKTGKTGKKKRARNKKKEEEETDSWAKW